jgi:hypothetical protein
MENGVVKQGRILIILFVSLLSLSFFSCGQSAKGYGVVLWSTDEKLYHAGDVVSIIEDSTVRNSYTFKAPETGDKVETPKFRLMYFKKKKAASDWAKGFEPWKSLFAMTRRDGLAVRSAPDQNADRVYKLRLNEVMKVISKAEKKSAIGDYAGYWYEVLTEEGVKGYCFDLNIEVYDGNKGIPEQNDPVMALVDKALSKNYRPASFGEMIREGRIDLVLFNPDRGFFPDPETKTIKVVLEDGSLSFSYTGITPVSSGVYAFDGSTAQLSVFSDTDIALRYSSNNKEYVQNFTYIEDMELVIQQERERRQTLIADFTSRFRSLASSAYGSIRFGDDGSFTWENFSRLKPDIIPQAAAEKGTIQFFVFLSKELKNSYSGVISFHFENTGPDDFTHFLYSYTDRGVRFVSMPQRLIKDRVIQKENPSPIVISFSAGN